MLTAGKGGVLYVVDRDNLTHYNPGGDQNIQSIALGKANFSAPVYFNGRVYISPVSTNIQAYQLTNGLLSASPTSISSSIYDRRGGTLAISANGGSNGILWALQSNNDAASTLHANDAGNLANELYNSD